MLEIIGHNAKTGKTESVCFADNWTEAKLIIKQELKLGNYTDMNITRR